MESQSRHASLGRRTLEEIRQKRAAEKLSKASSVADLQQASVPKVGIVRSESGSVLYEKDVTGLLSQIKDLERKNAVLEEENKDLALKLQMKSVEKDALQKQLNDMEQTVPSLRKALRDVAMEKDAAVTAREDLTAQLRMVKKRLKEAEEEQYRTEEDAAALRAELNSLQQQAMTNPLGGISSMGHSSDQLLAMEAELSNLRSELERETLLRHQERQRLVEEQDRISSLITEKQVLEEKNAVLSKSASETADKAASKEFSVQEKVILETKLHDMAVMVERLENSRQKLLMEIDSQSSEIERLFEENSNLSASYEDAVTVVGKWETQVKDCFKQNEELRGLLDKLRTEQANMLPLNNGAQSTLSKPDKDGGNFSDPDAHIAEILVLKGQVAKEQSRAEGLSAEVLKLSAQLQQTVQAYNGLARIYKPVLRNIESSLIKMKQDGSVAVR